MDAEIVKLNLEIKPLKQDIELYQEASGKLIEITRKVN